jgi:hypothetical protein
MHSNVFRGKPLPHEKGRDFISGLCIIFSILFYLVIFHEPQTRRPMIVEKT